jgi:hypothetical protein
MFRSKDGVALQPETTGRVVGRLAIGIPLSVLPLPIEDIQLSSDVKTWRVMLFVIRSTQLAGSVVAILISGPDEAAAGLVAQPFLPEARSDSRRRPPGR